MISELKSYGDILSYLKRKRRTAHLLIGNGFSIAYDENIFSYNRLGQVIEESDDDDLKVLFKTIDSKNFEFVMMQLDAFAELAKAFSEDSSFVQKLLNMRDSLSEQLLNAVSELHPEHVFKIKEEESSSCASFLSFYLNNSGNIFSTNYDLLLYWVLMQNQSSLQGCVDGFGKEYIEQDEFGDPLFEDLAWGKYSYEQRIHYLHGAMHLFDCGITIEKEIYKSNRYLLENIKERIVNKQYPLFVTAGDKDAKLEYILHNQYLTFCYEKLTEITGSLVVVGFNFGEYDEHIIDAINKASKQDISNRLHSVYIGVHSERDYSHIKTIEGKFKCKVNIFNSQTCNIWR